MKVEGFEQRPISPKQISPAPPITYLCNQCNYRWRSSHDFMHCPKCLSRDIDPGPYKRPFIKVLKEVSK